MQPGVDASVVRRAVWRAWVGDVDDALAILTTAAAVADGVRTVSNGSAAAATASMTAALLQAARAAGMRSIAAAYGYCGPDHPVDTWKADRDAESPEAIWPAIQELIKGAARPAI